MDNEGFLRDVLTSQDLTYNQLDNLKNLRETIAQQIRDAIGGAPYIYYGGSYKKETMIKAAYDLDVVIHWRPDFGYDLESLYELTRRTLQQNWRNVRQKRFGWQIHFDGDFHIDVIPGKFSSTDGRYAYLFNSDRQGRFQTSIQIQSEFVLDSRRQDAIRLMKLWKVRKDVPIKSFILEQLVIKGCSGLSREFLEPQLSDALKFIADNILSIRLEDPANSNNIITEDLTIEQKYRIRNLAIDGLNARNWGEVFRGTSG